MNGPAAVTNLPARRKKQHWIVKKENCCLGEKNKFEDRLIIPSKVNFNKKSGLGKKDNNGVLSAAERVIHEARGYYFEAYSSLLSHESMIKDHVRTSSYKRAIELNRHLFKDKIVLDVGCGLGILSLFAASAGAEKVIGIDASDIALHAKMVVQNSRFNNITILHSKVEEVQNLPDGIKKVDIIVSEWMGVCLYHESMLGTVLYARDKWLKKDGFLFPDMVNFYLGCIDDTKQRSDSFNKWNSVCGFSLAPMLEFQYNEPRQEVIKSSQVVSNCEIIHILDLRTATADYPFTGNFSLNVKRGSSVGGFVAYFDAVFSKCHKPVTLSTSPFSPPTHWRQTVFYLREPIFAQYGDEVCGTFSLNRFEHNFRDLSITISGKHNGVLSGKFFNSTFILR